AALRRGRALPEGALPPRSAPAVPPAARRADLARSRGAEGRRARSEAALRDRRRDGARARARRLATHRGAGCHAAGRARPGGTVEDRLRRVAAVQPAARLLAVVPAAVVPRRDPRGAPSSAWIRASAGMALGQARALAFAKSTASAACDRRARPPFSAPVRVQRICTKRSITSI